MIKNNQFATAPSIFYCFRMLVTLALKWNDTDIEDIALKFVILLILEYIIFKILQLNI